MNTEQHSEILQPKMSRLSHSALHLPITGVFVVSYPHIFHAIRQK